MLAFARVMYYTVKGSAGAPLLQFVRESYVEPVVDA